MLQADATFASGNAAHLGLRRLIALRRLNTIQRGMNGAVADGMDRHADAPIVASRASFSTSASVVVSRPRFSGCPS
jgi:hypothetical protein